MEVVSPPEKIPQFEMVRAMQEIAKLPQASMILADHGRAERWIEKTWEVDPTRLFWHIKRASGIGGSEIGVAAMELSGGVDPFETMHGIVRKKLLLEPPSAQNAAMEIGSILEDHVRGKFRAFMDNTVPGRWSVDRRAEALLTTKPQKPLRPWLVGNPDEVFLFDGRRFVADYKVTISDQEGYSKSEVPTRYVFQLHHYALALEQHSLSTDSLLLVPYYKDSEGFFKMACLNVSRDKEIERQLIEAGDHCWKLVLDGVVPPLPKAVVFDISDASIKSRLETAARNFAAYDAVASAAYKQAAVYKEEIQNILSENPVNDSGSIPLGGVVNVSVSSSLNLNKAVSFLGDRAKGAEIPGEVDPAKVIDWAQAQGFDLSPFRQVAHDPERLKALLFEAGVTEESYPGFLGESLRIGVDRKKGNVLINDVKEQAQRIVADGFNEILPMLQPVEASAAPVSKKPAKASGAELSVA